MERTETQTQLELNQVYQSSTCLPACHRSREAVRTGKVRE
jgi:hypothetical protein